ncbi:uncharacterized protein DUF4232 [Stackebrandtia albiflava]|uniref:Uncharacterized protein DUF4232 n=1 Tax=Stackebrandtia albiflava TaxID=406432 RepID=A0A562ULM6_9ACTN|nr:DUF4232 domain-containing protein [Stackebrandtia albiflava]TWJ06518.1 uncharacterized protein DUF4232 [Stackebrandtia albiflava]
MRRSAAPRTTPVLLLGLALAVAGCGGSDPAASGNESRPSDQASESAAPECRDGVEITPGPIDAATGQRGMAITLYNCGTEDVALDGFPTVTVLDAARNPLDVTVNEGTTAIEAPDPAPLTVRPGESAESVILWRNTVTTVDGSEILEGAFLDVAATPGATGRVVTPESPLDLGNTGEIDVTAWAPAAG